MSLLSDIAAEVRQGKEAQERAIQEAADRCRITSVRALAERMYVAALGVEGSTNFSAEAVAIHCLKQAEAFFVAFDKYEFGR